MIKVFQTIVDKGRGNCLQASVASLFEKKLEEVPHFIENDDWYGLMRQFYIDNGYPGVMYLDVNGDIESAKNALEHDGGVGGYWDATVKSQTFENVYHAIVIDKDLNVIHDPNPNQKCLLLGPEDILGISCVKEDWYLDDNGKVVLHG